MMVWGYVVIAVIALILIALILYLGMLIKREALRADVSDQALKLSEKELNHLHDVVTELSEKLQRAQEYQLYIRETLENRMYRHIDEIVETSDPQEARRLIQKTLRGE